MACESEFVGHESCPKCGSKDNLARYSDGHAFCFGCEYFEPADGSEEKPPYIHEKGLIKANHDLIDGEYKALKARGISEETCRKLGYKVGTHNGNPVQIAMYYNENGKPVAQKLRFKDKTFAVKGSLKEALLFGQQAWTSATGKMVVVTEGEIDALSVSQIQGNKWPVVSIPNGAQGARKAISKHIAWLSKFETVVLMFDMDEPGQKAAKEVASLFKPGKVKIAKLPLKDPNDCLMNGQSKAVVEAIWNAEPYRPDGILRVTDLITKAKQKVEIGMPWWMEGLTKATYGRRLGEIYGLGAGTGVGKTDWVTQQMCFDEQELGMKVAAFYLEQNPVETLLRLAGKRAGKRLHVPDGSWTDEERDAALDSLEQSDRFFFYDSWGSTEWDVIAERIEFLATAYDVKMFYLDHLTALAAHAEDERRFLDGLMEEMAALANRLQIIIHFISHLTTPEGKPHEEGGRVMAKHFRGSRAIQQWSFFMFGLERNQQAEDPEERQTTTFRVLKDRFTGQANGMTFAIGYDTETGRLYEKRDNPFSEDSPPW